MTQFSSFQVRPHRRDIELRELRIRGLRSILKFVFFATTLVFVVSFVISAIRPKRDLQNELVKGDSLVFDKPTFIGHSTSGGKIIVTAKEATRPVNSTQGEVVLIFPEVTTQTGSKLNANYGRWDQINQKLLLRESVKLTDKEGNSATSDFAFWGFLNEEGNIEEKPVEKLYLTGNVSFVQLGGETISAASAIWNETSSQLLFTSSPIKQIADNSAIEMRVLGKLGGGTFGAQSLRIDSTSKIAYGLGQVSINSQSISASADSFEFHFDSKHLILRGNARATYGSN